MKNHSSSIIAVCIVVALLAISCNTSDSNHLDFNFEGISVKSPKLVNWDIQRNEDYSIKPDNKTVHRGNYSLKIEKVSVFPSDYPGICFMNIENVVARKSIKLTGFVKNENTDSDSSGFFIMPYVNENKFYYAQSKNFQGSHDWQEYSVEVELTSEVESFAIAVTLVGGGRIWVDDLKLFVDGRQVTTIPKLNYVAGYKEMQWMKTHVTALKTVDAGSGFDDLQTLKKAIGKARIVALGECTHGSSEVFRMKHRLIEFLASEMDFTIFSIEANMPEAYKLNDYVLHGKGDLKKLLEGMYFWTWNTQEVLNMIEWMKNFNASGKGRIQFTGFDMQFIPVALENIAQHFEKDRIIKAKIDSVIEKVEMFRKEYKQLGKEDAYEIHKKCISIFEAIKNHPQAKKLDKKEYEWLLQNARVAMDGSDYKLMDDYTFRDKCMAGNVKWIADQNPGAKIILWAHNGHVHKYPGSMGKYLENIFGNQYYNLGFLSNAGYYTAYNGRALSARNKLLPSEPGSFEYSFHKAEIPVFFLDFSQATVSEAQWLKGRLNCRSVGAMAMDKQFFAIRLSKVYNSIIYIDSTHASRCFRL